MNPWRGMGELPRAVWILAAASLINRAGTMALPFLVLYLTKARGFTPGSAGFALVVYGFGALLVAPLAGRLSDRVGALGVMKGSLFLSGATLVAYPFVRGYWLIIAITFVWSITNEAFRPASLSILTELVTPEQRKVVIALNRLAVNLGMSVGPAVGGLLVLISFPAIFIVDAITSFAAGLVLVFTEWNLTRFEEPWRADSLPPEGKKGSFAAPLADRKLWYFLLAMLPVEIVFFQHMSSMPLFLVQDLHLAETSYGLLFTINTGLIILIEVPLNNAMSHWSHRRALALGAAFCGLGFGALALASGFVSAAATVVIWTFGEMITLPASAAFIADIAPPGRRGAYMGFYTMSFSLAFIAGPWLGIRVLEVWGGTTLWVAVLCCGLLSSLMLTRISPAREAGAVSS